MGRHGASPGGAIASPPSDRDVARLVDDARAAADAKEYDRAARLAEQAINADPRSYPEAYRVLGEVALAKHEPAAALARYEAAAALEPDQGWPVAGAAEALTALGRKEEARTRLRDFIAAHPNADSDAYDGLAWAEYEVGHTAAAQAAFRAALKASHDEDADAHYGLAVLAADREDAATAASELRAVLAIEPERWDALKNDDAFAGIRNAPPIRALLAKKPKEKPKQKSSSSADEPAPGAVLDTEIEQLGRVTYAGARADIPVGPMFALSPKTELVRVGAADSSESDSLHTYFGLGGSVRLGSWTLSGSGLYGPLSDDIEAVGGRLVVAADFGSVEADDGPPTVELELSAVATHFRWADGLGPAGDDLLQVYGDAEVLVRPTPRFELTPRFAYFRYDKALDKASGRRVGSVFVLSEIGAFAPPRALAGARIGYAVHPRVTPFVEGTEILYAYGSGDATEALGGARVELEKSWTVTVSGGALLNRTTGPLVSAADRDQVLPLVRVALELTL
ncbi:MAG TPA: tetratricopeptide repeat protein [Polyangiaceae bacterium]|nr:tetratricopeptide repeat protein [Polyangiaceae bacterium]